MPCGVLVAVAMFLLPVGDLSAVAADTAAADAAAGSAAAECVVEREVMVPMRDGIRLATDVYRPAAGGRPLDGRLPVILVRTPYDKRGTAVAGRYFATHGYVFVAQDTRGRYGSEGVWHMLTDDGPDGVDCAAWIGRQAWSSGRIGMLGTSYVGGTQHAMAMADAPELATVIPVDAMANLGRQGMRNAGAFELRFWNWIITHSAKGSRAARDPGARTALEAMGGQRQAYLRGLPLRRGLTPLRLAEEYEDWLVEAMQHGADDDFWRQNNVVGHPQAYKDIPVFLVSGWYDSWAGNTTTTYAALQRTIKGPVYLTMGPWIHQKQTESAHGQVSFGEAAAIADEWGWRKEWYDRWLKGIDNSVGTAAPFATPVRIFVMGGGDGGKDADGRLRHGGRWRDEREWPPARAVATDYFLQPGGGLGTSRPSAGESVTRYRFDPERPVPTIGGNISSAEGIMLQGGWDQRGGPHVWNHPDPIPLSARNDVVVFRTEPLEKDVEVTGEIEVRLFASSSAVDTDFTAKLVDVYPPSADWPDGFDLNIGDGIVRGRFRESLREEKPLEPGHVHEFTILLYPTSNVFKRGHRIRVDISSSNFPRFDVNPNTGEPLGRQRLSRVADQAIHHDAGHQSRIILPVIPAE